MLKRPPSPRSLRHLTVLALLNALCFNATGAQDASLARSTAADPATTQEAPHRPVTKRRFKHRRHATPPQDDLFVARAVTIATTPAHPRKKGVNKKSR